MTHEHDTLATERYEALLERITDLGDILVAYSGGVDSTLLAFTAKAVLGERTKAVLATSDTYPGSEVVDARALAAQLGLDLIEVETYELTDPRFTANGTDRCYHCKNELFSLLKRVAEVQGLTYIADGTNADDLTDYRPGRRAAAENGVVSPLAEVGLTKAQIRELARTLGLPNWDRPSMACLASRFPYGQAITENALLRVSSAEMALRDLGLRQFRVRAHGDVARIEFAAEEIDLAWRLRDQVSSAVKTAGFTYASQDLDGYRTGSMNEVLGEQTLDTAR